MTPSGGRSAAVVGPSGLWILNVPGLVMGRLAKPEGQDDGCGEARAVGFVAAHAGEIR